MNNKFGSITAAELNEIRNEIKIEIRSLLCSSKQGLSEYELKKEYISQFGKEIPYVSLGYNNLYELMRSMPDVCYSARHPSGSMWIYYGVIDQRVEDLARLVRGQKTDKSSVKREQLRSQYRPTYRNNYSAYNRNYNTTTTNNFNRNIPADLQQQIKLLLSKKEKLSLLDFDTHFKLQYGMSLDFKQYGFNSLREMFEHMSHLVNLERVGTTPSGSDLVCLSTITIQNQANINSSSANLNESLVTNVSDGLNHIETVKKFTKEEEIIKENILKILKNSPNNGLTLIELSIQYEKLYKSSIDYEKYGFRGLDKFIFNLELENVRFQYRKPYNHLELKYDENAHELTQQEDDSQNENKKKEDFRNLKPFIKSAFSRKPVGLMDEFFELFEKYHGWRLDCRQYGFKTNDEMISALVTDGIIKPDFGQDQSICFNCEHLYSESLVDSKSQCKTNSKSQFSCKSDIDQKEKDEYKTKFIQDYIITKSLTNEEVIKQFASKPEHDIIISHVTHPCRIEIQLLENTGKLEKLMDQLDVMYNGFGSGDFDMPESYFKTMCLCASLYADDNWHRCKIAEIGTDKVLVSYIDYGGDEWQPKDKIKFLYKDFNLPCQAVTAKFANIRFNKAWIEDKTKIVNYLLKKVSGKVLRAKIIGFMTDLCLEIFDYTNKNEPINLNEVIVKEGYGEWLDERKELDFKDYETWKHEVLGTKPLSTVSSAKSQDPIFTKLENALNNFNLNNKINQTVQSNIDKNNNIQVIKKSKNKKENEPFVFSKQLKTKLVVYFDPSEKKAYKLNLVNVDDEILVHWSQVATLFGMSKRFFKNNLNRLKEEKSPLDELYFKVFISSDYTQELFDTVQNDFNIDLDKLNETEELFMLKFYCLYKIASDFLDEDYSKSLEKFISNNKVTGSNVNPEIFAEYKKLNDQCGSSDKSVVSSSLVTNSASSNQLMLNDSEPSISDLINKIRDEKTDLLYYQEHNKISKINKKKERISYFEEKLKQRYNDK